MTLGMHLNTSSAAGYQHALEGWAKAGIKNVELTATMLDGFLKTDDLAAARRVVTDLGLTPVSCTPGLADFWNPIRGGPRLWTSGRSAASSSRLSA